MRHFFNGRPWNRISESAFRVYETFAVSHSLSCAVAWVREREREARGTWYQCPAIAGNAMARGTWIKVYCSYLGFMYFFQHVLAPAVLLKTGGFVVCFGVAKIQLELHLFVSTSEVSRWESRTQCPQPTVWYYCITLPHVRATLARNRDSAF